jgi:hypothetical protein
MPGQPYEILIESDTDNQTMIVEYEGKLIELDFNPRPTWPTHTEIEQMVGNAIFKLIDPNWEAKSS